MFLVTVYILFLVSSVNNQRNQDGSDQDASPIEEAFDLDLTYLFWQRRDFMKTELSHLIKNHSSKITETYELGSDVIDLSIQRSALILVDKSQYRHVGTVITIGIPLHLAVNINALATAKNIYTKAAATYKPYQVTAGLNNLKVAVLADYQVELKRFFFKDIDVTLQYSSTMNVMGGTPKDAKFEEAVANYANRASLTPALKDFIQTYLRTFLYFGDWSYIRNILIREAESLNKSVMPTPPLSTSSLQNLPTSSKN